MNQLKGFRMRFVALLLVLFWALMLSINALGVVADKVGKAEPSSQEGTTHSEQSAQSNNEKVITQVTSRPTDRIPAKMNRCPQPEYPPVALRYGMEGIVIVDVLIDETGKVTSTKLNSSSGFEILDKTSLDYFYQCDFLAATEEGKPVATWSRKKLSWKIDEEEKEGTILGMRVSGDDNAKPFVNLRKDFGKECGSTIDPLIDSMAKDLSSKNFSKVNICTCMEDRLFSDKILKQFF